MFIHLFSLFLGKLHINRGDPLVHTPRHQMLPVPSDTENEEDDVVKAEQQHAIPHILSRRREKEQSRTRKVAEYSSLNVDASSNKRKLDPQDSNDELPPAKKSRMSFVSFIL